jgi:arylsulfatase A-like enzyme
VKEIGRAIGVALAAALLAVVYDVARISPDRLPRSGAWPLLGDQALFGFAVYGAAALLALAPLAGYRALKDRRRGRAAPGSGGPASVPLYAAACASLFFAAWASSILSERRGGGAWKTASWLADFEVAALGAFAAGWGVYRILLWCRRGRRAARLALAALLVAAPGLAAAGRVAAAAGLPGVEAAPPAPEGAPDIILIVVDTLRADALSCYGARRFSTPVIDGLAARGARFADAVAQASWTNPATASILTSRLPTDHGMTGHRGRIRGDVRTLAEVLAARGYRTAGVVANLLVSKAYGFDRGFQHWDEEPDHDPLAVHRTMLASRLARAAGRGPSRTETISAAEVVDRALALIEDGGRPFFLYLHLMDPHDPYAPPADLAAAADPGYAGGLRFSQGTLYRILRGEEHVTEADLRHARALYDAEVAGMDRELARLVERIRERLDAGRAVVALTSDHGEEFMEHGALGHEHSLYQELIHVPLIVSRPGTIPEGVVVGEAVSHIDVAPTLLEAAGLAPEPSFAGRSLVPLARGEASAGTGPVVSEEDYIGYRTASHHLRAARDGRWKVILSSPNVFRLGVWRREVYDLAADPGETSPLPAEAEEARLAEQILRDRLARGLAEAGLQEGLDAETEQRLRALGYVQ